jgi:hypothetical protein
MKQFKIFMIMVAVLFSNFLFAADGGGGGGGGSKEEGAAAVGQSDQDKRNMKLIMAKRFKYYCPWVNGLLAECLLGAPRRVHQAAAQNANQVRVSVEAVGSGVIIIPALKVNSDDTVGSLREAILSRGTSLGIRLFLGHGGEELSDNNVTLRDASVKDGSTIVVAQITPELYLAQQRLVMAKLYDLLPDRAEKDDAIARLENHPSTWVGVEKVSGEGFILKLSLRSNRLTGPIPRELGQLRELRTLNLSLNQLTGEIPRELGLLTELRTLNLSLNQLTGEIPGELGRLTKLKTLSLRRNQLTGPIPSELELLTELQILYLSNNQLTGPIPSELGRLTQLQTLSLYRNQLTGPIPSELGRLTKLKTLSLHRNQLTGEIPRELGQLTELQDLSLSENQLTGPIHPELGQLTQLQYLSLSNNQLTAETPPELIREGLTVYR